LVKSAVTLAMICCFVSARPNAQVQYPALMLSTFAPTVKANQTARNAARCLNLDLGALEAVAAVIGALARLTPTVQ
jgi:hypothetical protein